MKFNKFFILTLYLIIFSLSGFSQTIFYVDQQNGSDTNNGTSDATAFETFDEAEASVSPGDTIEIIGEYHNSSYNSSYSFGAVNDAHLWNKENSIRIHNLHGSAGNYITIKPYDSNTVLKGDGANIFRVTSSSYLKIEGFTITGEVDNIPLWSGYFSDISTPKNNSGPNKESASNFLSICGKTFVGWITTGSLWL